MPAAKQESNKIIAVAGGYSNETGISKAMAIGGLSPGIAQMTSPTHTPRIMANKMDMDIIFTK